MLKPDSEEIHRSWLQIGGKRVYFENDPVTGCPINKNGKKILPSGLGIMNEEQVKK